MGATYPRFGPTWSILTLLRIIESYILKAATVMCRSIQWLDWYPWSTLNGHMMNTWLVPWLTLNQHLIDTSAKGQLIFVDMPLSVNQYMSHSTLNWILTDCQSSVD